MALGDPIDVKIFHAPPLPQPKGFRYFKRWEQGVARIEPATIGVKIDSYSSEGVPRELIEKVRVLVESIELRNFAGPITGFNVTIHSPIEASIDVQMQVPDRANPAILIEIQFHGAMRFHLDELHAEKYDVEAKRREFVEILRYACLDALRHEVEECIFIENERALDPHRGELPPFPL
jgi:hypothetical protein